jgi:Flagellar transcriptional activator (FlhC)
MVAEPRAGARVDLGIFYQISAIVFCGNYTKMDGTLGRRAVRMRISDDRYHRERLRMELALRFLRHEARTQTIRAWTGLSDDRIRKLYRSYMSQTRRHLPRHRGKSPHQVAYFTRSQQLQRESALLASVLTLLGVLPERGDAAAAACPGLRRGELLCAAFEAYRTLIPAAQISFEHAVFLTSALTRGDQLRLGACAGCGSLIVTERFPARLMRCQQCAGAARSHAAAAAAAGRGSAH